MYTRVESRFWQDEKMRNVSDDARYLMLYLLTSPHRNVLGFYFLPSPYACFDLGWDEKRFQKGLQELISTGLIKYDTQAHVVLVKNYLKHNPLENPNQVKSAIEKLEEIPETLLFQDFQEIVNKLDKPFHKPLIERLHERLQKQGTGTETETEINNINMLNSADAESVTDTPAEKSPNVEKINEEGDGAQPKKAGKGDQYTQAFEQFWYVYPRKLEKKRAFRAWKARLKEGQEPEQLILAAKNYAECCKKYGTEQKFIKHPSTFLGPNRPFEDFLKGEDPNGINKQNTASNIRGEPPRDKLFTRALD